MSPLVVKIGGSLEKAGRLREVLDLVGRAERPIAVVPGGGVFADAVRETCTRHGLSDQFAHRQAILAMHQMASVMAEMQPRLVAVELLEDVRAAWGAHRIPIWLPLTLCQDDETIPEDWSITSDGLAARLAARLGGAALVLVKSCCAGSGVSATALARDGVVDTAFPDIVARARLEWRILGPGQEGELARLLEAAGSPHVAANAV